MNDVDPALVSDIEDANVYRHADARAKRAGQPVISFDCGVDDRLLEHNRRFQEHLQSLNVERHYVEFDGAMNGLASNVDSVLAAIFFSSSFWCSTWASPGRPAPT